MTEPLQFVAAPLEYFDSELIPRITHHFATLLRVAVPSGNGVSNGKRTALGVDG
jgi:hypothetical protein